MASPARCRRAPQFVAGVHHLLPKIAELRVGRLGTPVPQQRALVVGELYKLLDAAQTRWRKINSPELVALVRTAPKFKDGIPVERRVNQSKDAA